MRKAPAPTKVQGAFQNYQQQGDSKVKRGIYYFTAKDKRLIRRWKNKRQQGGRS